MPRNTKAWRLLDELDLEALALDAARAQAGHRALADALGYCDVRKTVMNLDLADFGAAQPAGFARERPQNIGRPQLVFAAAGEAQGFHLGVERARRVSFFHGRGWSRPLDRDQRGARVKLD